MSHKKPHEYYEYDSERDNESINCCQLDAHKQLIKERNASTQPRVPSDIHAKRTCTDTFCILFFFVAFVAWIVITIMALSSEGINQLVAVRDSNNRKCGFDKGVKNRPYLLFFDVTKCLGSRNNIFHCDSRQLCVSECPTTNFSAFYYLENMAPLDVIKEKLICIDEFSKEFQINSYEDVRNAVKAGYCTEWYLESEPIARLCLPRYLPSRSHSEGHVRLYLPEGTNTDLSDTSYSLLKSSVYRVMRNQDFNGTVVEVLSEFWPWIVGFMFLALLVSYIFIVAMRWITGIIVWSFLFGLIGVLVFFSVYTWMNYSRANEHEEVLGRTKVVPFSNLSDNLKLMKDDTIKDKYTWLTLFIMSVVVLVGITLILLFLRKRIKLAIKLIKEGSKVVSHAWSSLLFPIFPLVIQVLVFAPAILLFVSLRNFSEPVYRVSGLNGSQCTCQNRYKENDVCDIDTFRNNCNDPYGNQCLTAKCLHSDDESNYSTISLHLFNLLMFFWCQFFVAGFSYLTLAMTFATYYWTAAKRKLPFCLLGTSVCKVLRYHMGTVAFGSLLLAFLTWIRFLVNLLFRKAYNSRRPCTKFLSCCCGLNLLHKLLRMFSKNAYIMCAIKGTNFCTSAGHAFSLIIKNVVRASVLDGISSFIFFLMKLLISVCISIMAYYVFSGISAANWEDGKTFQIVYFSTPVFIVWLSAFIVSSICFGVYSVAVDTIFLCALEDLEENDGTPEKPYAMSKSLIKIFKVKNKRGSDAS